MVSSSEMQSAEQSEDYLTKENYHQKNSEQGYIYSDSKELLNMLEIENGQEVNHEIHTNLIYGYTSQTKTAFSKNSGSTKRRAGFDVVTSAPKSMSLLTEYYHENDTDKYDELINAHKAANITMMNELKKYMRTRIDIGYDDEGNRNRIRIAGDIVFSNFTHDITREIDGEINPQLHDHNYVYNIVACFNHITQKTEFRSLSLEDFFAPEVKLYLGQIYRNQLAANLRKLGYELEITNAKEGFFDIKGFEKELHLDTFSSSSKKIVSLLDEYRLKYPNANEAKLKEHINNDIKKAKVTINREELFKRNIERMEAVGITGSLIEEIEKTMMSERANDDLIAEHLTKAYKAITDSQSVFILETLIKETLKQSVHLGVTREEVIQAINNDLEIVQLEKNVYTTKTMMKAETYIIEQLHNQTFSLDVDNKAIERVLEEAEITLSSGQSLAVETISRSNNQIIVIQGDAGSGKTFAMKVINKTYKDAFDIIGIAPTTQAAKQLQKDSDIISQTVASMILKPQEKGTKQRLIVVDESSMIDSLSMKKLIDIAIDNNDKIVFIGDVKQFQAVGAGKMFAEVQKYGAQVVNVTENMRQDNQRDRDIVEAIKQKNTDLAMEKLDSDIIENKNAHDLIAKIVEDYKDTDQIICSRNSDRNDLNLQLRKKLQNLKKPKVGKDNLFTCMKPQNLNGVHKYHSSSFEIGNEIILSSAIQGINVGKPYEIIAIQDDNNIIVRFKGAKNAKLMTINVNKEAEKIQYFKPEAINLAVGEKIIFTKPYQNKTTGVKFTNGSMAIIREINGDNITVETDAMRLVTFNINDLPYLDYAYAITDYKAQGMSIDSVKILADVKMANLNSFYTQITRLKKEIKLYTTDKVALSEKIKNEQVKASTLDYTRPQNKERNNAPTISRNAKNNISASRNDDRTSQADRGDLSSVDSRSHTATGRQIERNPRQDIKEIIKQLKQLEVIKNLIEDKMEKINFSEIKKSLNTQNLLQYLSKTHDTQGHTAFFNKELGDYRVQVGTRNYTAVDYLLKHHKLEFLEINSILAQALEAQRENGVAKITEKAKLPKQTAKVAAASKPKVNYQAEIDKAKEINLAEFAAGFGYTLNRSKKTENWPAMQKDGDKILVHEKDGVWLYFNPQNDQDKGTIENFLLNRGVAKKDILAVISKTKLVKLEAVSTTTKPKTTISTHEYFEEFKAMKPYHETNNAYLNEKRACSKALTDKFSNIKVDKNNNIVTPMFKSIGNEKFAFAGYNQKLRVPLTRDKEGMILEKPIKDLNRGNKATTAIMADDFVNDKSPKTIVVSESFIDALSYMELNKLDSKNTILIATNGQFSDETLNSIRNISERFSDADMIIAVDNDKGGQILQQKLKKEFLKAKVATPKNKDFNEDLVQSKQLEKEIADIAAKYNEAEHGKLSELNDKQKTTKTQIL